MSEYINNREYRQKVLKGLIGELHAGKSVEEVKPRFAELIEGVSPSEISEMESALIMEGMPVEEIQRLCDVHAAVFKGSIEEIHRPVKPEETPGHPVHTFKLENRALERLINNEIKPRLEELAGNPGRAALEKLSHDFSLLWEVDRHYSRKENLLFPYMEKYGITAPPKVMWGVDDEIRDAIKEIRRLMEDASGSAAIPRETWDRIRAKAGETVGKAAEMIFKEENILFPMVLDTLSEDEWIKIAEESDEIGFCLVEPESVWKPARVDMEEKAGQRGERPSHNGYIKFDAGILAPEEINALLNTLPFDITFVDRDGAVKYFSQGKDRIFARPKTIIGRQVANCHPPASVHIVEGIVEDLKSGKKDHEDFWIRLGEKFVYIRYYAVRDDKGRFLGVAEVTQDIAPIRRIEGEKRLVSD